jgi:hypothetical protein
MALRRFSSVPSGASFAAGGLPDALVTPICGTGCLAKISCGVNLLRRKAPAGRPFLLGRSDQLFTPAGSQMISAMLYGTLQGKLRAHPRYTAPAFSNG